MDTTLDVNALVQQYIAARDLKAEIDKQWAEIKKKVTDEMDKIEGQLQEFLDANNVTTLRTASGTCYTTVKRRASVQDGEAFMEFVKAGNWDLIERRANSTAVEDWVNKHDSLPPGVNLSSYQTVGVRRANGKTD